MPDMYDVPRNIAVHSAVAAAGHVSEAPPAVTQGNETVLYDMGFSISEPGAAPVPCHAPATAAAAAVSVPVGGVSLDETGDDVYDIPRGTAVPSLALPAHVAVPAPTTTLTEMPPEPEDELYTYNHLSGVQSASSPPKAKPPPPPRNRASLPSSVVGSAAPIADEPQLPPPPPSDWTDDSIYGNSPEDAPPAPAMQDDELYVNADPAEPQPQPMPVAAFEASAIAAGLEPTGDDLYMNAMEVGGSQSDAGVATAAAAAAVGGAGQPLKENPYENLGGTGLRLLPDEPSYINQMPAQADA